MREKSNMEREIPLVYADQVDFPYYTQYTACDVSETGK